MVGDSIDDMLAGDRAGVRTVLLLAKEGINAHLVNERFTHASIHRLVPFIWRQRISNAVVTGFLILYRLDDLIPLLEEGNLGNSR